VTVYESDPEPGGLLRFGIPEYRLPKRILAGEIERIRFLGVEFRCGVRVGTDIPLGALDHHDAVFLAIGSQRSRPLGIGGERVTGVRPGLGFLREVNFGGRPRIGARVVVVGGGNTAMDCARTARRLGADVLVLYRRGREEMPAHGEEVDEAIREDVRIEFLAAPVGVLSSERVPDRDPLDAIGDSFGDFEPEPPEPHVSGLRCVRMRLGDPDRSGRRRPVPVEGSEFEVPADTVLTALGEDADLDFLPEEVRREAGVVRVNPLGGTSRTSFFAGGDITDEPHTVAFAIGSGKRAAIGIDRLLRLRVVEAGDGAELGELRYGPAGNLSMACWCGADPVARTEPVNEVVEYDQLNTAHFQGAPRTPDRLMPEADRRLSFAETNQGLTPEAALAEARRCFNCGVCNQCELCLIFCPDVAIARRDGGFEIAYEYCKGCGLCAAECPRGAITMTREGL
jgi:2-oxoacid:acceptor oxidoreductase delta subunit (pyruvate/2-ketoisovalerate family)